MKYFEIGLNMFNILKVLRRIHTMSPELALSDERAIARGIEL